MKEYKIPTFEKWSNILGEISQESIKRAKNNIVTNNTKIIKLVLKNLKNQKYTSNEVKRLISIILDNKCILDKTVLVNDGSWFNAYIYIDPTKEYINIILENYGLSYIGLKNAYDLSEMEKLNIIAEHCEILAININMNIVGLDYDRDPDYYQFYNYNVNSLRFPISQEFLFTRNIITDTKKRYVEVGNIQEEDNTDEK